MAEITMPQLGETVTEGTITRWFKHVGDQVAENEPLFEVSTDKVDSEVPSPAAGLLSEILVQEGGTVDVGTVLARIGDAGSVPAAEPAPARALEPAPPPQVSTSPEATPAPQPASEAPSSTMVADGTSMAAPAEQAAASARVAPVSDTDGRGDDASGDHRLLSPVVRRLIGEHGIDPATIEGTGAGGRITPRMSRPSSSAPAQHRPRAAPAPPRPSWSVASGPARHRRAVLEHPAAHRRAHGRVEVDVGAHAGGDGGRLPQRRAGAARREGRVPHRRGCGADVPAVRVARRRRRAARLPGAQRVGRPRRADRAPRRAPRLRRRPRVPGPDGAGRAQRRREAVAGAGPRGRRPRRTGAHRSSSVPTTSRVARSRSPTSGRTARP